MNEQFNAYMKQDAEAFMTKIKECPIDELYFITPEYLIPYLKYVREQKHLFFTAIKNTKALRLEESYDKLFRFVFEPILERHQVPVENRSYIMTFYIQGLMAVIIQWLKNDCKDTIEQIIKVMQECAKQKQ